MRNLLRTDTPKQFGRSGPTQRRAFANGMTARAVSFTATLRTERACLWFGRAIPSPGMEGERRQGADSRPRKQKGEPGVPRRDPPEVLAVVRAAWKSTRGAGAGAPFHHSIAPAHAFRWLDGGQEAGATERQPGESWPAEEIRRHPNPPKGLAIFTTHQRPLGHLPLHPFGERIHENPRSRCPAADARRRRVRRHLGGCLARRHSEPAAVRKIERKQGSGATRASGEAQPGRCPTGSRGVGARRFDHVGHHRRPGIRGAGRRAGLLHSCPRSASIRKSR
jgi:hypothetical protein